MPIWAIQLLASLAIAGIAYGDGFYTEYRFADDTAKTLALKTSKAETKALTWQADVSIQAGADGQKIADAASKVFEADKARQDGATQAIADYLRTHKPILVVAPQSTPTTQPNSSPMETTNAPADNSMPIGSNLLTWGFVRFHDSAAIGSSNPSQLPIASGRPDDAASDVDVSRFESVLNANYGACRDNVKYILALQGWGTQVAAWYADTVKKLQSGPK